MRKKFGDDVDVAVFGDTRPNRSLSIEGDPMRDCLPALVEGQAVEEALRSERLRGTA